MLEPSGAKLALRRPPCERKHWNRSPDAIQKPRNRAALPANLRLTTSRPVLHPHLSSESRVGKAHASHLLADSANIGRSAVDPSKSSPENCLQSENNVARSEENTGDLDINDEYDCPASRDSYSAADSRMIKKFPGSLLGYPTQAGEHLGIIQEAAGSGSEAFTKNSNERTENVHEANNGRNEGNISVQESRSTKRSVPFWKCSSRKRQLVSPSSSNLAPSSTKDPENLASFDELLLVVGKRNKNLEHDLNQSDNENKILRAKINMVESERRKCKDQMKILVDKIKTEKSKLDESFTEMKFQVASHFVSEKRRSETCSKEISLLREEVQEYLKAFQNFHDKSGIEDDEILAPNSLSRLSYRDARQVLNVAKEIDDDRSKSTQK